MVISMLTMMPVVVRVFMIFFVLMIHWTRMRTRMVLADHSVWPSTSAAAGLLLNPTVGSASSFSACFEDGGES